jgi:hypothetical protein
MNDMMEEFSEAFKAEILMRSKESSLRMHRKVGWKMTRPRCSVMSIETNLFFQLAPVTEEITTHSLRSSVGNTSLK